MTIFNVINSVILAIVFNVINGAILAIMFSILKYQTGFYFATHFTLVERE